MADVARGPLTVLTAANVAAVVTNRVRASVISVLTLRIRTGATSFAIEGNEIPLLYQVSTLRSQSKHVTNCVNHLSRRPGASRSCWRPRPTGTLDCPDGRWLVAGFLTAALLM